MQLDDPFLNSGNARIANDMAAREFARIAEIAIEDRAGRFVLTEHSTRRKQTNKLSATFARFADLCPRWTENLLAA
jgi:hypothetical protein